MLYVVCEGHGEPRALANLVTRLWKDLALPYLAIHTPAIRYPGIGGERGLLKAVSIMRNRPGITGLLVVADQDDKCPVEIGPRLSDVLRRQALPFPSAYHVMYREFETLFLPCLPTMAGKPLVDDRGVARKGIRPGSVFSGNLEGPRDAKGIVSSHMHDGRAYKPTLDQLPLTRLLDFGTLRSSGLPCFGTLERCLIHLANTQSTSMTYP